MKKKTVERGTVKVICHKCGIEKSFDSYIHAVQFVRENGWVVNYDAELHYCPDCKEGS